MLRLSSTTHVLAAALAITAAPLLGCSGDDTSPAGNGATSGTPGAGPTFHADVEPILQKHCQSCHFEGRIAPFPLVTYEDAKNAAPIMVAQTKSGAMPPWGALETDACKPRLGWKDDPRLTADEIATLEAWSLAGAPEGDPKDAPPAYTPPEEGLPGVAQTIEPDAPYTAGGDKDEFRCFVIDPKLTETKYLNGWNFVAGNKAVVHHALMFVNADRSALALADEDGGYDCFGGAGVSDAQLVAAWAPGGRPVELEPNIGTPIQAGSVFVMQIHYHPAGLANQVDSTKFQMRFTADPEYQMVTALIGNFGKPMSGGDGLQPGDGGEVEFRIPANAKDHVESMIFTMPDKVGGGPLPELKLYGVATHMHYVGTDMKIEIDRGAATASDPASECLLETPKWDFSWQRFYSYDAPIESLPTIHAGDKLKLRCVYDNTTDNPFVVQALKDQKLTAPKDVTLGETTLDEMCLGGFAVVYKAK